MISKLDVREPLSLRRDYRSRKFSKPNFKTSFKIAKRFVHNFIQKLCNPSKIRLRDAFWRKKKNFYGTESSERSCSQKHLYWNNDWSFHHG